MTSKASITHWTKPNEVIVSEYGAITYREWCEKERDRINKHGVTVKIVKRAGGDIALSR